MSIPFMNSIGTQITAQHKIHKPLVLNEGQMFHGQVRQLFPGQLAEVQIGEQKMIAKMDVPMKAGESYYFQVAAVNPEVQLKIISGPIHSQASQESQLHNLMQAMQLPKTAEMAALLPFIMENKMPITRDGLLQAVHLLQMSPASNQKEALLSIQKLLELKLPLTESNFRALLGVETKEGLHSVLDAMKTLLTKDSSVSPQMRMAIIQLLDQIRQPFDGATGRALLGESLKVLTNHEQSAELRFSVLQLLKESNVLPRTASLPNLPSTFASLITEAAGLHRGNGSLPATIERLSQFTAGLPFLSAGQIEKLQSMMAQGQNADGRWMQQFASTVMQILGDNLAANPIAIANHPNAEILSLLGHKTQGETIDPLLTLLRNVEKSDNTALRSMLLSAEANVSNALEGKAMKEALQTIIRSLGMNYEPSMLNKGMQLERLAETLKPQLLTIINDPMISASVRETAEQLVVRMNGSLLASGENGTNHQLIMQIPLEFFGKRIDATLQWNGRMKDDKQIDADFARILFYLNLHSLQETIVDMQVQNRIVTISVFNADSTLASIGQPWQEKLKNGLEGAGYQLSGVFFKNFEENKKIEKRRTMTESYERQGVDFRI